MGGRREQTTCTVQCAAGPDCRARDQTVCALCGTHLNGRTHTSLIPSRRDGLDTHSTTSNQTDVGMGWTRTVLPAAADGRRTVTHTVKPPYSLHTIGCHRAAGWAAWLIHTYYTI